MDGGRGPRDRGRRPSKRRPEPGYEVFQSESNHEVSGNFLIKFSLFENTCTGYNRSTLIDCIVIACHDDKVAGTAGKEKKHPQRKKEGKKTEKRSI
jgi:hypothetical protein